MATSSERVLCTSLHYPYSRRHRKYGGRLHSLVTAKRKVVQKLPEKGHRVRPSAIRRNAQAELKTHAVTYGSLALSPESDHYRSLVEIWVALGASAAEMVSRTKSPFGVGTPLALPLTDGRLSFSRKTQPLACRPVTRRPVKTTLKWRLWGKIAPSRIFFSEFFY